MVAKHCRIVLLCLFYLSINFSVIDSYYFKNNLMGNLRRDMHCRSIRHFYKARRNAHPIFLARDFHNHMHSHATDFALNSDSSSSADRDVPLNTEYRYFFFKIEASGLLEYGNKPGIFELAAVDATSPVPKKFSSFCALERDVSVSNFCRQIFEKRHISNSFLSSQPPFSVVWKKLCVWIKERIGSSGDIPVLVAFFGCDFDFHIVQYHLRRSNLKFPAELRFADPYMHVTDKLRPHLLSTIPSLRNLDNTKLMDVHFNLMGYRPHRGSDALEDVYMLYHVHRELDRQYQMYTNENVKYAILTEEAITANPAPTIEIFQKKATVVSPDDPSMGRVPAPTTPFTVPASIPNALPLPVITPPVIGQVTVVDGTRRVYLNVPFSRKADAKTLGARFDFDRKKWYVFEGVGTTGLEEFMK